MHVFLLETPSLLSQWASYDFLNGMEKLFEAYANKQQKPVSKPKFVQASSGGGFFSSFFSKEAPADSSRETVSTNVTPEKAESFMQEKTGHEFDFEQCYEQDGNKVMCVLDDGAPCWFHYNEELAIEENYRCEF